MPELNEERVREIAREEILKREMEKIGLIAKINALAGEKVKKPNKGSKSITNDVST